MKLKLLQLNIEEGKRYEEIVTYVLQQDFDILHFQEVTSGEQNLRGMEIFKVLKKHLEYEGIQAVYWRLRSDPNTYMSNATLFKPSFTPVSSHIEFLKPYEEVARERMDDYASLPTCALDVAFNLNGKKIHFINAHLVWGPTPEDKPYKLEQGKKLYDYVKSLQEQFVLSGDFNVSPDSQIVSWINELGRNHVVEKKITNTLNPNLHRAQQLFPKGLAVDFLFTEKSLKVKDFQLVDSPDLSDHYGLTIEIEV